MASPPSRLALLLLLLPCIRPHPCNFPRQFAANECIYSNKTAKFWCISEETDEPIFCPRTCETAGGNDPGQVCVFPFILAGANRSECVPSFRPHDRGRLFCATSANFDRDGRWTFCEESPDLCGPSLGIRVVLGFLGTIVAILLLVLLSLHVNWRLIRVRLLLKYTAELETETTTCTTELVTEVTYTNTVLISSDHESTQYMSLTPSRQVSSTASERTVRTQVSSSSTRSHDQKDEVKYTGVVELIQSAECADPDKKAYLSQRSYEPLLEHDELEYCSSV